MPVTASLRALLAGVIDYAGLFPPAALPLEESIRNYARYAGGDDESGQRWMLGRFICPAARLVELVPFVGDLFDADRPLVIAALGRGGRDAAEFVQNLGADVDAIGAFRGTVGGSADVDVFETRLPGSTAAALPGVLDEIALRFGESWLRRFCEAGFEPNWRESLPHAIRAIAGRPGLGYKLRSGGVEAGAFPSPEQVACAIIACRDAGVPMKFTAGLHHPVGHFDAGIGTKMHGFLNVYVACVLARARQIDESLTCAVLEEEHVGAFTFSGEALRWRDLAASISEVEAARRDFAISFGSCSFDEPRDDLRSLRLI